MPGADNSYGYDALDQLTDMNGSAEYGYDTADNTTKNRAAIQGFDPARQLTSIANPNGNGTLMFDSHGRRVAALVPGAAEALRRYRDDGFLLAGVSGVLLIVPLGGWVLHEACRNLAEWREIAPELARHSGEGADAEHGYTRDCGAHPAQPSRRRVRTWVSSSVAAENTSYQPPTFSVAAWMRR